MRAWVVGVVVAGVVAFFAGCGGSECGPSSGVVADVHDGDTITLESGEKIRYLMIDAPEVGSDAECYGNEARDFNASLVLAQTVTLRYDQTCTDRFGRLLAYVFLDGREVNTLMVERGYACVLHIPPNGDDRAQEFETLEDQASSEGKGLWGFCSVTPC
ncbi:MAG: thermonuclease family protein [Myxococcaceae bacterium]|nr:thermonuclease family protein [Myxococcaceae bacterium]